MPHAIKTRIYTETANKQKKEDKKEMKHKPCWLMNGWKWKYQLKGKLVHHCNCTWGRWWCRFFDYLILFVVDVSPWSVYFIIYYQMSCTMSWRTHSQVQIISRLFTFLVWTHTPFILSHCHLKHYVYVNYQIVSLMQDRWLCSLLCWGNSETHWSHLNFMVNITTAVSSLSFWYLFKQ